MAASFGSDGSDDGLMSEINVTPLVDVVLVLLVIFMITAPAIYKSAIKVQLPRAATGERTEASPLSFTLGKDGTLAAAGKRIGFEELPGYVRSLSEQIRSEPAVISADEGTPHGTVIRLMDLLRQEGLTRFALNVDGSAPGQP